MNDVTLVNNNDDDKIRSFVFIPKPWFIVIVISGAIMFSTVILLSYYVYITQARLEVTEYNSRIAIERNKASAEYLGEKIRIEQWMFNELCDKAKKEGRECLSNPRWRLNPAKYPELSDSPAGDGLFEKE